MLTGETHALYDVSGTSTPRNNEWFPIDHGIRKRSGGVIAPLANTE
jgi:hypothetical protein